MASTDLEEILREFADRIRELVRKEIVETLTGEREVARGRRAKRTTPARIVSAPRKGQKRDPNDILALVGKLHAVIGDKPGKRVEEIAKEMGVSTKELALPVKKLLGLKKIRTTGTRRATKYFPK